jgi:hypothetical protein
MIGAKRLAPAIIALLVTASTAWSQPAVEAENDATTTSPQQNPGADADNRADNGDVAADTTPPQASRPPGDYRASEQISEDLSVSFPVDI